MAHAATMWEMQVDNFCKFDYSEKVTVYMSHEQRSEIEREARAAHLKVSDWCRRDLADAVSRAARERDQSNDKRPK